MLDTLTTAEITAVYNTISEKHVSKFTNKTKALARTEALLNSLGLRLVAPGDLRDEDAPEVSTINAKGVLFGYLVADDPEPEADDGEDELLAAGAEVPFSDWSNPLRVYFYVSQYLSQIDETGKAPRGFHQYFGWVARNFAGWTRKSAGYGMLDSFRDEVVPAVREAAVFEASAA